MGADYVSDVARALKEYERLVTLFAWLVGASKNLKF
jgi:hypothetical protein